MEKWIFWIIFFSISAIITNSYAQKNNAVKGLVIDANSTLPLVKASISILNSKDSILLGFSHTDTAGAFKVSGLKEGNYLLLVTYPDFADYVENFTINQSNFIIDFKKIHLQLRSLLLKEVIVKAQRVLLKIKGDTTEYEAGAFKVHPNANVEDLLKRLPGIQVDREGKITAQGETVTKVLIDGEEFFSDDPTLVTKNVRADMVDKVQLYNKKSDQAAFTGVDDGQKNKTINLKLKADKKRGYFGKLESGEGTNGHYEAQGMFNKFTSKDKFAVYGITSNTGRIGLGVQDGIKYGTVQANTQLSGGSVGIGINNQSDGFESFDGNYNGEGIPATKVGGMHYDFKWDDNKQSLNTNYQIESISILGQKTILSQYNFPGGLYINNNSDAFKRGLSRQNVDVSYQDKIDTNNTIKFTLNASSKNGNTTDIYKAKSVRDDSVSLNQINRSINNNTGFKNLHTYFNWNKKFKKKGRTFSVYTDESFENNSYDGILNSAITFYNQTGIVDSVQSVNQLKKNDFHNTILKTYATYTEPLSKILSLAVTYGLIKNNSSSDKQSYNPSPGGFSVLDSTYTNFYRYNQTIQQGGLTALYKKRNIIINLSSKISFYNTDQINLSSSTTKKRDFLNLNPHASYQLNFAQQGSLQLTYDGITIQPTIQQLQPIATNDDPLNILIGNPNLLQSYKNSFNIFYNSYKIVSSLLINVFANYDYTNHPIVYNTTLNAAGQTFYQPINSDKPANNYIIEIIGRKKIAYKGSNVGLHLKSSGVTSFNIINNVLNRVSYNSYQIEGEISNYTSDKYDMSFNVGPIYIISASSIQQQTNNGGGFNINGHFDFYLPFKFQIEGSGDYQYRGRTESFNTPFEKFLINSSLSKRFLKKDQIKLAISGYDLLNQNRGYERSAYLNVLTQSTFTNINRYFMVSLIWNFNKTGG